MSIKKVYDFLDEQENGKELIGIIKGELAEITTLAKAKGQYKEEAEKYKGELETYKPFLEIARAENLTPDTLKSMLNKSREGETEIDRLKRDNETILTKFESLQQTLEAEKKQKEEIAKQNESNKIKEAFIQAMPNLDPNIRTEHLELKIAKGDLRLDENGLPVGKYGDNFVSPKEYNELLKADRPSAYIGKSGAGSKESRADNGGTERIDVTQMTPAELFAKKYENVN